MSSMKQLYVEASEMFYDWEKIKYGDNSPLSDHDREVWIQGYVSRYMQEVKEKKEVNDEHHD